MTPGWPFPFFTLSLPFTTTHAFLGKNKHGSPLLGGLSLYKTADVVVKTVSTTNNFCTVASLNGPS